MPVFLSSRKSITKMGSKINIVLCALVVFINTSYIRGQSTDSPLALTPIALQGEVVSAGLPAPQTTTERAAPGAEPNAVNQNTSAPSDSEPSKTEVTHAVTLPVTDAGVRSDTVPPPISTVPPVQPNKETTPSLETKETSPSSDSGTSLPPTGTSPAGLTPAPGTTLAPAGGRQTASSPLTPNAAHTTRAAVLPLNPGPTHLLATDSPQTSIPTSVEPAHQDVPSELDVGDEDSDQVPHHPSSPLDPLLAGLVSVLIASTAIVSVILFLRFRQRNEHPEFHRLQDLPMDDLMEDTPLSRYSYTY